MPKIKLSKRLEKIASLIDNGSVIADIGCDHAFLDIYLIQNKVVDKAFACDVTEGALDQAKKNILLSNVSNIETRLGDGLSVLKKEDNVDTVIMAGLGNQKIISILKENKDKLKNINTLIIQSNTKVEALRKQIIRLGYYISDEKLVEERNIIYTIIKFSKGSKNYNKKELYFGPILLQKKEKLFVKLWKRQFEINNKILSSLPKSKILKKIKLMILNKNISKILNK